MDIAHHLSMISDLLKSRKVNEKDIGSADKDHFIINPANGRTLRFSGDREVNQADAGSGEQLI